MVFRNWHSQDFDSGEEERKKSLSEYLAIDHRHRRSQAQPDKQLLTLVFLSAESIGLQGVCECVGSG